MTSSFILAAKLALACAATLVLAWDCVARSRRGRRDSTARVRDVALAALGVISLAAWWNFGVFHLGTFLHYPDVYHYFVGSKYFNELRYTELYRCTAAADIEAGLRPAGGLAWIRDLSTNELEHVPDAMPSITACRWRFSEPRWQEFSHDVAWFRERIGSKRWPFMSIDHGYNGTPLWTMVGGTLAAVGPASDALVFAVALIDPALVLIMLGAVWWAFGWRTAAVAVFWIGLSHVARYYWVGGSFLRWDWVAASVLALCLARRNRFGAAGLSLGYASLLRVIPGFLMGGLFLRQMWQRRDAAGWRSLGRTLGGFASAVAVVLPLTGLSVGTGAFDVGPWREFAEDNLRQVNSPTVAKVGLRTLVAFQPSTRLAELRDDSVDTPWDTWRAERKRVFTERLPYFVATAALLTGFLAWAMRRVTTWEALVLGVGFVPVFVEVAGYYYVVLVAYALLWPLHRLAGVLLAAAAGLTCLAAAFTDWDDELHAAISVVVLLLVGAVTLVVGRASPSDEPIR